MCGLTGFVDFNKATTESTLIKMTNVLSHRGPDSSGHSLMSTENASIGLGHRRLSILDLSSSGYQPMIYKHFDIVYNGEVYNFQEIKEELIKKNYRFDSHSDTEVILKAYSEWGENFVNKLIGMFVIVIHDKHKNVLLIFRDRAGVKPCYYYFKDDLFLFSSELKSFHEHPLFEAEIDRDVLALYLSYGYVPEPYSIFQNSHKLESGKYMIFDIGARNLKIKEYWNVLSFYEKPKLSISYQDAISEMEKILKSSFEYRMISDVPVGVFLSGGYDSTLVTSMLQKDRADKIKTFTIGFHEKGFNEAHYAKEIANYLGTDHVEYYCTQKDAAEILPKLCEIYDEPFADSSAIPTVLVSKLARESVTVSLSADGGDEIFGGYDKYFKALKYNHDFKFLPKSLRNLFGFGIRSTINNNGFQSNLTVKLNRLEKVLGSEDIIAKLNFLSQPILENEIGKFLKQDFSSLETTFNKIGEFDLINSEFDKMMAIDYKTYMNGNILTKVDRATMSVGLEGREPLLDHRIVEFAAQLPIGYKSNPNRSKKMLRDITHKYINPKLVDRPKKGFSVPIVDWFKDELRDYLMYYLDERKLIEQGIFNPEAVLRERDGYLSNKKVNVNRLWIILMFQMWYEKWLGL